jgi:hypothetical protein
MGSPGLHYFVFGGRQIAAALLCELDLENQTQASSPPVGRIEQCLTGAGSNNKKNLPPMYAEPC